MRRVRFRFPGAFALTAFLLSTGASAAVATEATDPRLHAAIERALADNPEVAEVEYAIEAARARSAQAGTLPDPRVTASVVNVPLPSFSFAKDDMTMKMIGLEQTIPGPGKRAAARRVSQAQVETMRTMHADHVNRLVSEVADAYFELSSLDARIAILNRSLEQLKRVSESVRARYSVGQGTLPDVLLAGVEETKARDRMRALEAERATAAARFNTLQNLAPDRPVEPVPPPAPIAGPSDAVDLATAVAGSPAVRRAGAELKHAEEEARLSRFERRPDFTITTSYGERDRRDDMVGASVGFNLPFVQRRRVAARIAEKEAELSRASTHLALAWLETSREVRESLVALASAKERADLYRKTILMQDETAARAAEEAYAVGKIDFQTYIRAVLAVDEDEAAAIEREAAIPRARAKLQAATGIRFYPYSLPELETTHD